MEAYISELTQLAKEVHDGVALDDGELSLIALNGLDSSYDSLVNVQIAHVDDIPFSALQGLLQAHEARSMKPVAPQQCAMANMIHGKKLRMMKLSIKYAAKKAIRPFHVTTDNENCFSYHS